MGLRDAVQLDSVAAALGPAWNGKFGVNAELNLPRPPGPTASSTGRSSQKYKPKLAFGLGSFGQMGFIEARIAIKALLNIKPPYTKRVNEAFKGVKNFHTDILCNPWTSAKSRCTSRTTRTER